MRKLQILASQIKREEGAAEGSGAHKETLAQLQLAQNELAEARAEQASRALRKCGHRNCNSFSRPVQRRSTAIQCRCIGREFIKASGLWYATMASAPGCIPSAFVLNHPDGDVEHCCAGDDMACHS